MTDMDAMCVCDHAYGVHTNGVAGPCAEKHCQCAFFVPLAVKLCEPDLEASFW